MGVLSKLKGIFYDEVIVEEPEEEIKKVDKIVKKEVVVEEPIEEVKPKFDAFEEMKEAKEEPVRSERELPADRRFSDPAQGQDAYRCAVHRKDLHHPSVYHPDRSGIVPRHEPGACKHPHRHRLRSADHRLPGLREDVRHPRLHDPEAGEGRRRIITTAATHRAAAVPYFPGK